MDLPGSTGRTYLPITARTSRAESTRYSSPAYFEDDRDPVLGTDRVAVDVQPVANCGLHDTDDAVKQRSAQRNWEEG